MTTQVVVAVDCAGGASGGAKGAVHGAAVAAASPSAVAPSQGQRVGSCVLYCVTAVAVSQALKGLFSVYGFKFHFFVMAMQMMAALVLLTLMRTVLGSYCIAVPELSRDKLKAVAPQALIQVLNVAVGFVAMSRVNIPLFLCMRRTVLFFVLGAETLLLGRSHPRTVRLCVAVMVVGAIMAAWDGLHDKEAEGSASAIGFVIVNNACTALYLIQAKKFSNAYPGMSSLGLMYHQAVIAMPAALLMAILFGEVQGVLAFESWGSLEFQAVFALSCTMGFMVGYAIVFVTKVNSPLVMSITGSAKDVFTTIISLVLFGGFKSTPMAVSGILLSLGGSLYYSLFKSGYLNKKRPPASAGHDEEAGVVAKKASAAHKFRPRHNS